MLLAQSFLSQASLIEQGVSLFNTTFSQHQAQEAPCVLCKNLNNTKFQDHYIKYLNIKSQDPYTKRNRTSASGGVVV